MLAKKLESAAKAVEAAYIEDVFSTYLYTGNNSTQTIVNGIDLAGKGGLVWNKSRNQTYYHNLYDTTRGVDNRLFSNTSDAASTTANTLTSFNSDGFTIGNSDTGNFPPIGNIGVSWTFREQAKFFDIVTYTGNGAASRNISHALGSKPGFVVLKRTDSTGNWFVAAWTGTTFRIGTDALPFALNSTNAYNTQNGAAATSTTFDPNEVTLSSNYGVTPSNANINGATYVAYLFAHNAGGFGLSGSDNVISCGSYTGIAYPTSLDVNVGFEPQWVLIKNTTTASGWAMWDVMRGMAVVPAANTAQAQLLEPNTTAAESIQPGIYPTATGFVVKNGLTSISGSGDTMIYIAIRRGPMKVPTLGTSVFSPIAQNNAYNTTNTTNFPVDLQIATTRNAGSQARRFVDRLRGISSNATGAGQVLESQSTAAETSDSNETLGWNNTGYKTNYNYASVSSIFYNMGRAPSFFDEVCYTGTSNVRTVPHNLGVVPELMIIKARTNGTAGPYGWPVYSAALGNGSTVFVNTTAAVSSVSYWNNTTPTASVFSLGTNNPVNDTANYVAYLFATCAGVSKVGSYTGTATTKQVDCGFTAGARFVLIKRTDSTGDWYVWDTARGIVSGNDPYLLLNSTAAEVTSTDYIDPYSAGFEISSTAPAAINASGGTYIFLAIA